MGSDWSHPDMVQWKKDARRQQQEYHLMLSDRTWDQFKKLELKYLRSKIAIALYGIPQTLAQSINEVEDPLSEFSKEQQKKTIEICDIIVKLSKPHLESTGVLFAIIFVCIKMWEKYITLPVFRVAKDSSGSSDNAAYVDSVGRVYNNWMHYLGTNNLPKCMYCYPTHGFYCNLDEDNNESEVDVSYGTSPACDFVNRLKTGLDVSGIAGSSFSAGVLVTSFFTPIGPVLALTTTVIGATSAVYGAARSTETLIDHSEHDQSISITNPEARAAWIGLFGSLLGVTASGTTTIMVASARSGHVFNMAGRLAVTTLNWGSLTINGVGVINGLAHCIDKRLDDKLTPLDVYQFSLSVLFFSNGVINAKTASKIIKETQTQVLGEYEAQLKGQSEKEAFARVVGSIRGNRIMHGRGTVIKGLAQISNLEDFFKNLVSAEGQADHHVSFTERGLIRINDQLEIHPDAFSGMSEKNRSAAMEATRKFSASELDSTQFLNEVKNLCSEESIRFECQRNMAIQKAKEAFCVNDLSTVKVNKQLIFKNLEPYQKDRLAGVLQEAGGNYDSNIIQITKLFADSQGCKDVSEFCSYIEFVSKFISNSVKLRPNQSKADCRCNIIQELLNKDSLLFNQLNKTFQDLKANITQINESNLFAFKNSSAATYHYFKHDTFAGVKVDANKYFQIANELFGKGANETNVKLTQEGNSMKMTYKNAQDGLFGVLVKPYKMSGNNQVWVATLYYDKRLTRAPG